MKIIREIAQAMTLTSDAIWYCHIVRGARRTNSNLGKFLDYLASVPRIDILGINLSLNIVARFNSLSANDVIEVLP